MNTKLLLLLTVFLLACLHPAQAQQPAKVPRIGFLSGSGHPSAFEALRKELQGLGYKDGENIIFEYRSAEGNVNQAPGLVAELVQLKVDVLVSTSQSIIRAAKQATRTIPIVIMANFDPVATGIVPSLARPGGNITGLTTLSRDLSGKRLEFLKEAVPTMSRVGIIWDPHTAGPLISFKEYEAATRALKIQLQSLEIRGPTPDLESAFQAATKGRINAVITIGNSLLNRYRSLIAELAIKNRLPSMCDIDDWVEVGCLMAYSADDSDNYRRAATYVYKILKGAKPADLPVEQPTRFELVINLKTAKQIGLTIPAGVLARADKVIR
jgi:putative ABC transport system substrate-binding protein